MVNPGRPLFARGRYGVSVSVRPGDVIGYGRRGPIRLIGGAAPEDDDPPARTFSQDDLNRIAAREKDQGRAAALNEVAATLGMPVDEAKKLLDAARAAEDARKTQAERDAETARQEKAQADQARSEAAAVVQRAKVERALLVAGLPAVVADGAGRDAEEAAERLLERAVRLVDIPAGADAAAVAAVVTQLKQDLPALFSRPAPPPLPGSTPPTPAPAAGQQRSSGEFGADGAAEARRRFGDRTAAGAAQGAA
jgi:hypothetical protein